MFITDKHQMQLHLLFVRTEIDDVRPCTDLMLNITFANADQLKLPCCQLPIIPSLQLSSNSHQLLAITPASSLQEEY